MIFSSSVKASRKLANRRVRPPTSTAFVYFRKQSRSEIPKKREKPENLIQVFHFFSLSADAATFALKSNLQFYFLRKGARVSFLRAIRHALKCLQTDEKGSACLS